MDSIRFGIFVVIGTVVVFVVKYVSDSVIRYTELERGGRLSGDQAGRIEERLERLEAAIDAVAIEVERLSETNRFVAQLAQESRAVPTLASPERINTPH